MSFFALPLNMQLDKSSGKRQFLTLGTQSVIPIARRERSEPSQAR